MSALIFILATLLMIILPLLAAAVVFSMTLPGWLDRALKSDPDVHERLQIDVSEESIAWVASSDGSARQGLPWSPLAWAAFAALAVAAIETAVFAVSSSVPRLWLVSGTIAAGAALVLTILGAWLFRNRLRRLVNRALAAHASEQFSFAEQTVFETWWTTRQIDKTYARIGLPARSHALEDSRRALLTHARLGRDSALAEAIGIKHKADQDLRSLEDLGRLLTSAYTVVQQAKSDLRDVEELQETIAQIEQRLKSAELADALENARWPDAHALLEKIGYDLGKLLDLRKRDAVMPESAQDAYRLLNVDDETPLDNIKAVVTAYRRVWHPDLARDEVERQRSHLRMQRINVAWDLIQKERALADAEGGECNA
jgi:hypothetical protein